MFFFFEVLQCASNLFPSVMKMPFVLNSRIFLHLNIALFRKSNAWGPNKWWKNCAISFLKNIVLKNHLLKAIICLYWIVNWCEKVVLERHYFNSLWSYLCKHVLKLPLTWKNAGKGHLQTSVQKMKTGNSIDCLTGIL